MDAYEIFKYFLDEFSIEFLFGEVVPRNRREKVALEVFNRLNDIHSVIERMDRYEIYFSDFLPTSESILEAEAIEYHLHSYLQDVYSLSEKIGRLLNLIKNKLPIFNIGNSEDIRHALDHLKNQVGGGLTQVLELRGKHVHDISVRDSDLLKAKLIKVAGSKLGLSDEVADKKYNQIIISAKEGYIKQAKTNKIELQKMKNFLFPRIGYLFASVYGHNASRFDSAIKATGDDPVITEN